MTSDAYATWDAHLADASDESDGFPDRAMVPYVEALRAAGVVTLQSCAGHEDSDGALWFDTGLTPTKREVLRACPAITHVEKKYKPEWCWAITFTDLHLAMECLFDALGLDLPAEVERLGMEDTARLDYLREECERLWAEREQFRAQRDEALALLRDEALNGHPSPETEAFVARLDGAS